MKFIYIVLTIVAIFIVTVFTFNEDFIYYNYAKYSVNDEEGIIENDYYYEDDFAYIDDYKGIEIHNKKELYESVYYLVNSGITTAKRYFDIKYTDYENDYNELFSDELKLNTINNFVHPYNSFTSIEASLKGYVLEINVNYNNAYDANKRAIINNEVNRIISELFINNMKEEDKIKVIHDYIVNNTTYDENFCISENDCTNNSSYQSDTAYGVLFEHNGICSGYTDLMAIFLSKIGIVNYRVTNDTHTWNAVYLDNVWYHLDATWDDPISKNNILTHTYFLITPHEDSLLDEPHNYSKEIFIELS